MVAPLVAGLGAQELVIIALILVMLFGAKKLPELARGTGRALRIFKAETKGLHDDDDDYDETPEDRVRELRQQSDARRDGVVDAEFGDRATPRPERRTER